MPSSAGVQPVPGAARPGPVSRALARDQLGIPKVLSFIGASVAAMTVAAGVIPTAYQATGLTGIPAAFLVIAVVLGVFAAGYVAMARHITNSGAFYAFITAGLGRVAGVAAALVALLSYGMLQPALYGALGPAMEAEAAAHLGIRAAWWAWALAAWAAVTVLGQARVDTAGRVLGVLLVAELAVTVAEAAGGLLHPAGGHLSFAGLSPATLGAGGFGTFGALAVIAVLGFVGFEQAPVFSEETRRARRAVPAATYISLAGIGVVYAGVSWSMAVHAGPGNVVAAAAAQGPGLLYGLAGSGALAQAAQLLFVTSLFAAALAFHNVVWRYMFALGREHVLPPGLGRTNGSVPRAASLTQSAAGLAVIIVFAVAGWNPMTQLFFWLGTTGGFGILVLLALTSAAVIAFFARDHRGESAWRRLAAPAAAAVLLTATVVLAVQHYAALLGTSPGDPATWMLPASYAVIAAVGAAWAVILRTRRPGIYAGIGLGPRAGAAPAPVPGLAGPAAPPAGAAS